MEVYRVRSILRNVSELPMSGENPMTQKWRCKKGCYECCRSIQIPKGIWLTFVKQRQRKVEFAQPDPNNPNLITVITEDGFCAYLSKDGHCHIYKHRPGCCREFGIVPGKKQCPYIDFDGRVRTPEEVAKIKGNITDICLRVVDSLEGVSAVRKTILDEMREEK
jgi:Fe-S-cluster containining protein